MLQSSLNCSHSENSLFSCVTDKKLLSCCERCCSDKNQESSSLCWTQSDTHPLHHTQTVQMQQKQPLISVSTRTSEHAAEGQHSRRLWQITLGDVFSRYSTGVCLKSHCLLNHLRVSLKRSNKPSLGVACSPYLMGYNILQCKALQQYSELQPLEPSPCKYYEPYGFNNSPPVKRKPELSLLQHRPLPSKLKNTGWQQQEACVYRPNRPLERAN